LHTYPLYNPITMSFRTLDEQTSKQVHHKMNKNKIFVVSGYTYIYGIYMLTRIAMSFLVCLRMPGSWSVWIWIDMIEKD
jgi:hypothetical protein